MKKLKMIELIMNTGKFDNKELQELSELPKNDIEVFLGLYLEVENEYKTKFILKACKIMCESIRHYKVEGNKKLLGESYKIVGVLNKEIKGLCEYFQNKMKVEDFLSIFGLVQDEDWEFDEEESYYENLIPTGGNVGHIIRTSLIQSEAKVFEMFKSTRG